MTASTCARICLASVLSAALLLVPTAAGAAADLTADYCTDNGGTVETRHPYWGTNLAQSDWVRLEGWIELCRFVAPDDDDIRIYIDTSSLASLRPTLAAAAYLAQVPLDNVPPGVNPASADCDQIVQGTSSWGTSLSGGGWVNFDDPDFTVVNLCVFPDGSAIDEWGITYYSGGVVRGADLAPLFRFNVDVVRQLFPE
jgi:putative hemolysin